MRSGQRAGTRYGSPAASVGAFAVLFLLAAGTLLASADLMSTSCIGDSGQMLCPADGPGWARPVPAAAVLLGLLTGVAGLAIGRPVRRLALIAGFALVAAGAIVALLIG
ncbi:hypothetical protein [Actinoplanes sp. URMC 104]|uniref:hypothetical protein n=1 Tax=Actinoplanes sp. URMC 104 TaxID=3423409 RepID=UPI003F53538F